MSPKYLLCLIVTLLILVSCSKNQDYNAVTITPIPEKEDISLILILGDGMGIPQLTAAYAERNRLHLQDYPYSGLVLTQSADKFVTESGAGATAMLTGFKTNYGYQGMDVNQEPLNNLYQQLKNLEYKTAVVTTSFITDATLAAIYRHGTDRYDYENIALDYLKNYPDFCVAGGKKHFDERTDGLNLLDSLSAKGVKLFYEDTDILSVNQLPALGLLYPSRPPYLNDGRSDFLKQSSLKALELLGNQNYFLFLEGALIDLGGHDTNINRQIEETLELDEIAGLMLDYAKTRNNVLVVVVSDHESGGLSLMQGEGMSYIPDYALDEHSGNMVAVFAYGPGAEQFTGLMDNTDIYLKLANILKINQ
jgi:alkaline phosphatase